jgi:hypothetical protein
MKLDNVGERLTDYFFNVERLLVSLADIIWPGFDA